MDRPGRRRVHHRPASPPLAARVAGALTRWGLRLRAVLRLRAGRVLLGGAVTTVVTGLVLAVPVVSSGSVLSSLFTDSSPGAPSQAVEDPVFTEPDGGWPAATPGTTGTGPDVGPMAPDASSTTAPSAPPSATAGASAPPASSSASSPSSSSAPAATSASAATTSSSSPDASPAPGTPSIEAAAPVVPADLSPEEDLLAALDRPRAEAGCDPLRSDGRLTQAAREHSKAMRDGNFFGLVDDDGDSVVEKEHARVGWVAQGPRSPAGVVKGWLAGENAASLQDCSLTAVGIGRSGGDGGPWWTLLLA
jgi:uncharacterized protein YkwD